MARIDREGKSSGPVLLSDILKGVIHNRAHTKAHGILRNIRIFHTWEKIVGPFVRKHSVPSRFQYGRLYVGVSHPSWKIELNFKKKEIREKINKSLGKNLVDDIVFYLFK